MKHAFDISHKAHIIKRESGWALKKQGSQRASGVYRTKSEAIEKAQPLKKKQVMT